MQIRNKAVAIFFAAFILSVLLFRLNHVDAQIPTAKGVGRIGRSLGETKKQEAVTKKLKTPRKKPDIKEEGIEPGQPADALKAPKCASGTSFTF